MKTTSSPSNPPSDLRKCQEQPGRKNWLQPPEVKSKRRYPIGCNILQCCGSAVDVPQYFVCAEYVRRCLGAPCTMNSLHIHATVCVKHFREVVTRHLQEFLCQPPNHFRGSLQTNPPSTIPRSATQLPDTMGPQHQFQRQLRAHKTHHNYLAAPTTPCTKTAPRTLHRWTGKTHNGMK